MRRLHPHPRVPGRRTGLWAGLALFLGTLLLYAGVRANGFVLYDDATYVSENPAVRGGLSLAGLRWAFANGGYACNFHPLAWLSHMLDVEIFDLEPAGHHLTSAFLHGLNAALCFAALSALTSRFWPSLLAAALFAAHPLRVESVAWVSERKDVLAGTFFFLALLGWARYAERPKAARYAAVLAALAAGLLAKPMLVTLPLVLLLLDAWPLTRARAFGGDRTLSFLLREKAPLFLLAALSSVVTLLVQSRGGCTEHLDRLDFAARASNALVAYARYLGLIAWPNDLAVFYPHPALVSPDTSQHLAAFLSGCLLAALSAAAWKLRGVHGFIFTGWFWFLVMLLPVIGIVQVGGQALADRYAYLPAVGIHLVFAFGAAEVARLFPSLRFPVGLLAAIAVLAPLPLTLRQIRVWKDTRALFEHALEVTQHNYIAHVQVGRTLGDEARHEEARAHFEAAAAIHPGFFEARYNLGQSFYLQRDFPRACEEFGAAVRLRPGDAKAHYYLGLALGEQRRFDEAEAEIEQSLRLRPDFEAARSLLEQIRALRERES